MKFDRSHGSVVTEVFETVASAASEIQSSFAERRDVIDSENPSGEIQLAADVWADELLLDRIGSIDGVGRIASEERSEVVSVGSGVGVTVDPLDGSSNLESNNLMGTIVGIYDASLPAWGRTIVGAAYVLYGPTTTMVTATDENGVTEYVLVDGGMMTTRGAISLPADPLVYGFGGRVPDWPQDFARFVDEIEQELKLRYGGAFVGDVNQVLQYGGIFAYPALKSRPEGKLRLQFEANPISYIIEKAGGAGSTGNGSVLDVPPDSLHQRTPIYVGSKSIIGRLESSIG